jgi:hypothetical protein
MGRGLDGLISRSLASCAVLRDRLEAPATRSAPRSRQVSGGYCVGETPLPIPNRAVKPHSADGTWPARAWESRSPPVLFVRAVFFGRRLCVVNGFVRGWRGRPGGAPSSPGDGSEVAPPAVPSPVAGQPAATHRSRKRGHAPAPRAWSGAPFRVVQGHEHSCPGMTVVFLGDCLLLA